jgi:hypothetical protein
VRNVLRTSAYAFRRIESRRWAAATGARLEGLIGFNRARLSAVLNGKLDDLRSITSNFQYSPMAVPINTVVTCLITVA